MHFCFYSPRFARDYSQSIPSGLAGIVTIMKYSNMPSNDTKYMPLKSYSQSIPSGLGEKKYTFILD